MESACPVSATGGITAARLTGHSKRNHNGSVLEYTAMPTTLTLKNIPDEVYERLKLSAELHRRSLNSEAIVCLETVLLPARVAPAERLRRARELRESARHRFKARDIDSLKRTGRA